jgi:hypothetical protein
MHFRWASKTIEWMDVFQTPDTLDKLSKCPPKPNQDIYHKLAELELEEKEPQVLSCKWVDGDEATLGVYFSWSKRPKPESNEVTERPKPFQRYDNFELPSQISTYIYLLQKKRKPRPRHKRKKKEVPASSQESSQGRTYLPLSQQEYGRTPSTIPWELPSRCYDGLEVSTSLILTNWSKLKYSRIMS